jgi:hypothetical protein
MMLVKVLSPTTNNYDYVNYAPNTQSNKYPSITLISGVQKVSEDMWLQIVICHFIQPRLLEKCIFDQKSDYCVQASWQGPFCCSRNNTHLEFHTYLNDFMCKLRNLSQNGYGPDIIQHGHA